MCRGRDGAFHDRNNLIWNYQRLFLKLFKWKQRDKKESETRHLVLCLSIKHLWSADQVEFPFHTVKNVI